MNIHLHPAPLEGVLIVEPEFFEDERGFFFESYSQRRLQEHGLDLTFVQDNHSRSARHVVRGLHYQDARAAQYRLVRCTVGEVWDVVVDLRAGSPTFGKWTAVHLTAAGKRQVLIPPPFAHGFCVLSEVAEVQYKCSNYHTPEAEHSMRFDDPDLAIAWPVVDPVVSDRDRNRSSSFKDYLENPSFLYRPMPDGVRTELT